MTDLRELDRQLAEWMGITILGEGITVPYFSSDIAAAFQVVEFVRARGYGFVTSDAGGFVASFILRGTSDWHSGTSDTLPEAIARAALAVMEAEQKEKKHG